jgi:hypothetical protein
MKSEKEYMVSTGNYSIVSSEKGNLVSDIYFFAD